MEELNANGQWKLNMSQTGFRKGMGCELNILRITETIRNKLLKDKNNKLWTLFIDLKSAFDTVNHEILF